MQTVQRFRKVLQVSAVSVACFSGASLAQTSPTANSGANWQIRYGAAVISAPKYIGSGQNGFILLPSIEATYKNFLFISPLRGVGLQANLGGGFSGSAALGYDFTSRKESDSTRLRGLGDVDSAPALLLELNYRTGDFFAKAGLRSRLGSAAERGSLLTTDLGYDLVKRQSGSFSAGLSLRTMDSAYASNFFGVNSVQSAASKLPVFQAASGIQSAGVFGQALYRIDSNWSLFSRLDLSALQGDAADSPIVQQKNQIGLALAVSRAF